MIKVAAALAAIPLGVAPRRFWGEFSLIPVETMAPVSGILTAIAGLATGGLWFFGYLQRTARVVPGAEREVAVALLLVSLLAFVTLTPAGWFSSYLLVSGVLRFAGAMTGEPFGDPLLGLIDRAITAEGRKIPGRDRARRPKGSQAPDRLRSASWAGIKGAVYVVVASEAKPDWTPGTTVVTDDAWYTLGLSFEMTVDEAQRTIYPLQEHRGEVLRRSVRYDLPPLERPGARTDR